MKTKKNIIGASIIAVGAIIALGFGSSAPSKAQQYLAQADAYIELARQESCKEIGKLSHVCFAAAPDDKPEKCVPMHDAKFTHIKEFSANPDYDCAGEQEIPVTEEDFFGDEKWNQ